MLWEKMKSVLLYGGLTREQYKKISPEIDEANRKSVVLLSVACLIFYSVRLLRYSTIPAGNRFLFHTTVALFALLAVVNTRFKNKGWLIHGSAYLFLAIYLGTGIFSSIGNGSLQQRTTLYLVFVSVGPMLYALNALELAAVIVPSELVYLALIWKFQSAYPVYATNRSNSLFFAMSGLLLGVYMANMKISGIYNFHLNAENQKIRDLNAALSASQTQLEAALVAAEQANRAKTGFLNTMSHDIRTPMNAILGFAELAEGKAEQPERVKEYLTKIRTAGRHLLSLINDCLDMSRIESGTVELQAAPVNLRELTEEVCDIVQSGAAAGGLNFVSEVHIRQETVLVDSLRLRQILLNLLGNAIKFTSPGGTVRLALTETEGAPEGSANLCFRVEDTGIGMSEEFQKHLFEAFSRENTSAVRNIQGTGLGMAITKNLVDLMGGSIAVSSQPGRGTSFRLAFRFPVSAKTEAKAPKKTVNFTGKRLLLAEDNSLNAELATEILETLGFCVDLAKDGREAVAAIQGDETYDAVLMDLQMPNMDGLQAARTIRSLADPAKAGIPILAMTADAFEASRRKTLEAGMNGHITKPIEVPKLIEALQGVLGE